MNELHLFAGIGGGVLAGQLLGHRLAGLVESNPFCQQVLRARFPGVPLEGDIRNFYARPLRGVVDLVAGGFPCQDISLAGKGAGLEGTKSSLWFEMLRVVSEVEPSFVFVENSPALRTRGLDRVLEGLASLGFDAEWAVLGAEAVGAPHMRRRLWILGAHPDRCRLARESQDHGEDQRLEEQRRHDTDRLRHEMAFAGCEGPPEWPRTQAEWTHAAATGSSWWAREPALGRVVDGFPGRMEQLHALGNAQVPFQAAYAFSQLKARFYY